MPQITASVGGVISPTSPLSKTVLFDDFEDTPFKWAELLATVARMTTRAYNGTACMRLTFGGFTDAFAARGFPALLGGRVSLECRWAAEDFSNTNHIEFLLVNVKKGLVAAVRYLPTSHFWALPDDDNNNRVLLPSHSNNEYLPLPVAGGCWHAFKVTVDFDTGRYETLEADEMALDISGNALNTVRYFLGSPAYTSGVGNIVAFSLQGLAPNIDVYFDDVRVATV